MDLNKRPFGLTFFFFLKKGNPFDPTEFKIPVSGSWMDDFLPGHLDSREK